MISEISMLFFKISLTIHHTVTISQKKVGLPKKNQWDFQISRVGNLDFLDLKVNGSPGCLWGLRPSHTKPVCSASETILKLKLDYDTF